MTKVVAAVVLGLVAINLLIQLVRVLRHSDFRQDYLQTVRSMRWWMLPAALGQWKAEVDGHISVRVEATVQRFQQVRTGAIAKVAAAHAISNWVVIAIFVIAMIVLAFVR